MGGSFYKCFALLCVFFVRWRVLLTYVYIDMRFEKLIVGTLMLGVGMAVSATPAYADVLSDASAAQTQEGFHPYFDRSATPAWSKLTAEQAEKDIPLALEIAQTRLKELCAVTDFTYENTFGALEKLDAELDAAAGLFYHLSSVMDSPARRDAEKKLMPSVSVFQSSLLMNDQLWKVLKKAGEQPWVQTLDPHRKRYVELTLDAFRTGGADLPEVKKARLAAINHELEELTREYSQNILDATNAWHYVVRDRAEIAGMPESWERAAREEALAKGFGTEEEPCWLVTLQYTSMGPLLKYAESEELRRKVFEASDAVGAVAPYNNERQVRCIIELRREMASLLGFKSYADLTTHNRMAGNGETAMNFVNDLHRKTLPAFQRDINELFDYIGAKTGVRPDKIYPWNRAYWTEKLRAEKYDFDAEQLRPYYAADNVFRGMFDIYSHLYDIRVTERPVWCALSKDNQEKPADAVEVWHPDVRFYEVHDNKSGELLGSFYMDWFPRCTKRSGGWMLPIHVGKASLGTSPRVPHMAVICGNLTKPSGDKPALFSHYDVETLFHEFGHLMHVILSDVKVSQIAGTNVPWDFVELPSQINENWTWDAQSSLDFARHYQTGKPMPQELFAKMLASRNFMAGMYAMNQLCIAKDDLEMYVNYDKYSNMSLDDAEKLILKEYAFPYEGARRALIYNLPHIISGGYSAGYYSYKWAEVLAADAFTRFRKEGVKNPAVGKAFRESILSKGNTKPVAELFRDFMGRDPDPDALLISQGIMPTSQEKK